jgi:uncharacterized protein (DUF427 family)
MAQQPEEITRVKNAIHNPNDVRHFMRIRESQVPYAVYYNNEQIARSEQPLSLHEVGFDIYDPVIYFPLKDLAPEVKTIDEGRSTHCPLKGNTLYYTLKLPSGDELPGAMWVYAKPFGWAEILKDYAAFDPKQLRIVRAD